MGGVWGDGTAVSTSSFSGRPTRQGREAVVRGWVEAIGEYLGQNELKWEQVGGVGLAIPGPFQRTACSTARRICRRISRASTYTRLSSAPDRASGAGRAAGDRQRRRPGRRGRGAAGARQRSGDGGDAGGRLRTRLRLHRPRWTAPGRRHPRRHGGRPHARAVALTGTFGLIRAVAAGPGAASRFTRLSPDCPTCWPTGWPITPTTAGSLVASTRKRVLVLRGLAQKGDSLAVELFDFQARRWDCTSPTWRWPSIRNSSSSAAG